MMSQEHKIKTSNLKPSKNEEDKLLISTQSKPLESIAKSPSASYSPSFFKSISPFLKDKSRIISSLTSKKSDHILDDLDMMDYSDDDIIPSKLIGHPFINKRSRDKQTYMYQDYTPSTSVLIRINDEDYMKNYYTNYKKTVKLYDNDINLKMKYDILGYIGYINYSKTINNYYYMINNECRNMILDYYHPINFSNQYNLTKCSNFHVFLSPSVLNTK